MKLAHLYLLLCLLGTLLPMSQFIPWLVVQTLDAGIALRFVGELFSTRIGGFFGLDVIVSAIVLLVFILAESRRSGVRPLWVPLAGTLLVGVSLGLPLFLYFRERQLIGREPA
jgi:hypothetical protein